jgi:sugar lactone lactonase YvrE
VDVDVQTGAVKVTPLGKNQSKSLYTGSAVTVTSTPLSTDASELTIKKLKLSIHNNTADSIDSSQLIVDKVVTDAGAFDLREFSNVSTIVGPGSSASDGPGPSVTISQPTGIARDTDGTLYLAGSGDGTLRKMSGGFVTRIATGIATPGGVAVLGSSVFMVEQSAHNLVRVPTSGGSKFVMAGGGVSGLVDGSGAAARFNAPRDIEIIGTTAFISDNLNDRIRTATNLAGGSATIATLNVFPTITGPSGLAHLTMGGAEWLVVTSTITHKVYLVNSANGQSFIIGGTGVTSSLDGPGNTATFNTPYDVAVAGNAIFVSEVGGRVVRQMTLSEGAQPQFASSWIVKTVAGAGSAGSADGPGATAQFSSPRFMATDGSGAILVSDLSNNRTRKITAASGVFPITGSGGGTSGTVSVANPDSFILDPANFNSRKAVFEFGSLSPSGTAEDTEEKEIEFTVAEGVNAFWFVVSLSGGGSSIGALDAFANLGSPLVGSPNVNVRSITGSQPGYADGSPTAAQFNSPYISATPSGVIYVADNSNNAVRRFDPSTGMTRTIAGLVRTGGTVGGSGTTSRFVSPTGIWMNDTETEGYLVNYQSVVVMRLSRSIGSDPNDSNSWTVAIIAGLADTIGLVQGTGDVARFGFLRSLAVDSGGSTLYVTDSGNNQVRMLTIAGGLNRNVAANWNVSLVAGDPAGFPGDVDGSGTSARFNSPSGIVWAKDGNVYLTEGLGRRVRRLTPDGQVTLVAGSTTGVMGAVDGVGSAARFSFPTGICLDNSGYAYVADDSNGCVRRVNLTTGEVRTVAGVSPSTPDIDGSGQTAHFTGPRSVAFIPGKGLYTSGYYGIRLVERVIRNGAP